MKKELKSISFTDENALCNFVNEKQISQENIQAIVQTTVYDQIYVTLYYWVITEQQELKPWKNKLKGAPPNVNI